MGNRDCRETVPIFTLYEKSHMLFLQTNYDKIKNSDKAKEDGYEIDYRPGQSGQSI